MIPSGVTADQPSALKVKNANHEIVLSAIGIMIRSRYSHVCSCSRCISDMAALALNSLPPHYYVAAEDSIAFGSPLIMVECAVIEAIERVSDNPRHCSKRQGA